jgi:hypothetical protein
MSLSIKKITGNINWQFPMSKEVFEQLQKINPRTERNDFSSLYHFSIAKMKEAGVTFYSPGASPGRRFTYWFNSHFWQEDFEAPNFEKEDFIFKEVYALLKEHGNVQVVVPPEYISSETIQIENGNLLNDLGKSFLISTSSLNSKKVQFV